MKAPSAALLTGPVAPALLRLSLPGMAAMLAASLSALTDALLLSRGSTALSAAVSVSFSLLTLIQTIGFTLGMGAGSFVSRTLGSGDVPPAYAASATAMLTALALALLLCAPGFLLADSLVRLLGCPPEAAAPAAVYARYVLACGPMLCASLVLSSLLRAQGKAVPYMVAFVLGAAVGIGLNVLLVAVLRLGVHGGGLAMLARETITLSLLLFAFHRDKHLVRPRLRAVSLRPQVYHNIMRSGLPTLVRQGLMSLSSILLTRACAGFGSAALAGMGLCVRAVSLISSAVIGFGQGFQPICGTAFGAGDMARVRSAYRFCLRFVTIALALAGAAVFLLCRPLLSLFQPEADVLAFAVSALRAQSLVFFAQGAVIMMNMLTQSLGLTVRASVIASSRQGFVLIPLLVLLPRLLGVTGLIVCQSMSDLLSLLLCALLTRGTLTDCACARGGCSDARKASR